MTPYQKMIFEKYGRSVKVYAKYNTPQEKREAVLSQKRRWVNEMRAKLKDAKLKDCEGKKEDQ